MKSSEAQKKESNSNSKTSEPSLDRNKEDNFFSQFQDPTNPFTSQSEENVNPFSPQSKENPNPFLIKQVTLPHTTSSIIQKQSSEENSLSFEDAKEIILKELDSTFIIYESTIYDAIERCKDHKRLKQDSEVVNGLNKAFDNHKLWKCYLLMEYGKSNFPNSIIALWMATKGNGTNEDEVFAALQSMDKRAKESFGLEYFLSTELSGDDLQRALDIITVSDSIGENIYGSSKEEKLVITKGNLRTLIDSRFAGASSIALKDAMMTLYSAPPKPTLPKHLEALTKIESIRGLPPGAALAQYEKAMQKKQAGIETYKKKAEKKGKEYEDPSPSLDTSKHKDFTASSAQLRFGKILGDVFGIDAVFGSLISPTGGMAGPGNNRIPLLKDGGAVTTHGAVHDAAGYLYNCHDIGPGYDYLQNEKYSDPTNPLAGQTNIEWWIREYERRGKDVEIKEKTLGKLAYPLSWFAKDYKQLYLDQKKKALEVMSIFLRTAKISEMIKLVTLIERIRDLMEACNVTEKVELIKYFYKNDGFKTIKEVYNIIKLYQPK